MTPGRRRLSSTCVIGSGRGADGGDGGGIEDRERLAV
jgi:hypothetical protein